MLFEAAVWFGYGFVLASATLFIGATQNAAGVLVASAGVAAYTALSVIVLRGIRWRGRAPGPGPVRGGRRLPYLSAQPASGRIAEVRAPAGRGAKP